MSFYALIQWSDLYTSIIDLANVCTPSKEIQQYKEGEYIEAKFQGKLYRTVISEISDDRKKPQRSPPSIHLQKTQMWDGTKKEVEFVTRKDIDELKEEMKRLKRRVLKEEQSKKTEKNEEVCKIKKEDSKESDVHMSPDSDCDRSNVSSALSLFNGYTMSNLISHYDKLYEAVNCLMLKLFPKDYIINHSVSGKSGNSKLERKMAFDPRLYCAMVTVVKNKFPNVTTKDITDRVHSVQKCIKREKKKCRKT